MSYSEKAALERLSQITDPLTDRDIIAAGRLADIAQKDGLVRAVLQIDPSKSQLADQSTCEGPPSGLSRRRHG